MIGIYKITNKINNKIYIGQSSYVEKRWERHRTGPFNPNNNQYHTPFYRAIRKYGLDNFNFEVIEECSQSELNDKEIYWIKYYDTTNPEKGYNLTEGGYNGHFSKLDYNSLKEIKELIKNSDMFLKDIAQKYNISLITIKDINQGHSWYDENEIYPLRQTKVKKKHYCVDCGKEISKRSHGLCNSCCRKTLRKVERPTREELKFYIRTLPFTEIGKIFNVSDNAIRKWCDAENLPRRKVDINSYTDEEWELI